MTGAADPFGQRKRPFETGFSLSGATHILLLPAVNFNRKALFVAPALEKFTVLAIMVWIDPAALSGYIF